MACSAACHDTARDDLADVLAAEVLAVARGHCKVLNRWPDEESDLVGAEADDAGPDDAGQHRDVVELLDHALDDQPVLDVAGREVDHREVAERPDALALQPLVERQALEGAVLARARDADDRVVADEGQRRGRSPAGSRPARSGRWRRST